MEESIKQKIVEYLNAKHFAEAATEYQSKVVMNMELVDGDNYRMVWTREHSDQFPPVND